jgi:hypothetical protein
MLGGGGEARRALDAVKSRNLTDRLEGRLTVDPRVNRSGNRVRPEGNRALLSRGDRGDRWDGDEERDRDSLGRGCVFRVSGSGYETTLNGTTAPVFSQTIPIWPP